MNYKLCSFKNYHKINQEKIMNLEHKNKSNSPNLRSQANLDNYNNYPDQIDELNQKNYPDQIDELNQTDTNSDPITGEPGSHPVGTGVGAAGAGTVATVIGGVVGGPVGAVVGAVVGSVTGGLAGKGTAENVNPTSDDDYDPENRNKVNR
jgi:hypothetical protein